MLDLLIWCPSLPIVEYDEDVGGFQFTRSTRPKKPRSSAVNHVAIPDPLMEDSHPRARKQKGKGKATKPAEGPVNVSFMTTPEKSQRRRSRRLAEAESDSL